MPPAKPSARPAVSGVAQQQPAAPQPSQQPVKPMREVKREEPVYNDIPRNPQVEDLDIPAFFYEIVADDKEK
ncbi:hypothetical protein GCM10020331_045860 [Ectobacillus funiculus]